MNGQEPGNPGPSQEAVLAHLAGRRSGLLLLLAEKQAHLETAEHLLDAAEQPPESAP